MQRQPGSVRKFDVTPIMPDQLDRGLEFLAGAGLEDIGSDMVIKCRRSVLVSVRGGQHHDHSPGQRRIGP